ncbi:hypothetical protein AC1031_019476 [Aphanomyces cochlioides]|nr:hypothetical protein AC1031_019476 [Aphanomyces cochlioides]
MYKDQVEHGQYVLNACDEAMFKADMMWYMSTFRSNMFADLSRKYNALFAYTSIGAKEQHLPHGPPAYKIRGQLIHNIGAFEPHGSNPQNYAQIYVLAPD